MKIRRKKKREAWSPPDFTNEEIREMKWMHHDAVRDMENYDQLPRETRDRIKEDLDWF
jgi:adenine C2-methylase RlmN of 23S rRNA A2503 and tRNA A37